MRILVSACLLGVACRYDGKSKPNDDVIKLAQMHELVPFCPEIYGGLKTPRSPAENVGDKVVNKDGVDVTEEYQKGAEEALRLYKTLNCDLALLKEKSPSCGTGLVHNGLFDGGMIQGDGITVRLLRENGIKVIGESEIKNII